jgi:ABC-type glycerol-3-phosphate transport system permease component
MSGGARRWAALAGLGTALLLVAIALPLWIALVGSVTPEARLFEQLPFWPRELALEHYRALFAERDFWLPIRNSLVVAGNTTALCLVLGSLCAYALARLRFRGRTPLLAGILAISMFPQISLVAPLFLLLRALGLIDSYPGLVMPYVTFAMPLTIWLLVGYFRQLPAELEEAARVDGAGRLRVLVEIVLPLAAPALATTAILTFIYCWNEFLFALSFTLGPERQTVPVAIALFRGQYQVPWGEVLAAAMVATAPVAILALLFQRRIVGGLVTGAVKG